VPKKKARKGKDKPEDVEDIMSKLKGMPGMENIKVCLKTYPLYDS